MNNFFLKSTDPLAAEARAVGYVLRALDTVDPVLETLAATAEADMLIRTLDSIVAVEGETLPGEILSAIASLDQKHPEVGFRSGRLTPEQALLVQAWAVRDEVRGVYDQVHALLQRANLGHLPSYGQDHTD